MKTRKLSVAIAAILLGMQLGSPLAAAIGSDQITTVEQLVLSGDVDGLLAYLALYPELLELAGALGDALRAFHADPTAEALAAVADLSPSGAAVAAVERSRDVGTSIY